jgi:alpha-glucosidase
MHNVPIPADLVRDPREKQEPNLGLGRDPVRTPMQWDASPNAGFTAGTPWLPLSEDWRTANVAALAEEPNSMLNLHRRLLELRRTRPSLNLGDLALLRGNEQVLAYERRCGNERSLIALYLTCQPARWQPPVQLQVLLSTHRAPGPVQAGVFELAPDEAVLFAPGE